MKILIADDSRVMRNIVLRTLREAGYGNADIVQAEDGSMLYSMIKSEDPDLVLSDWNMPGMTGIEVLEKIRSEGDDRRFGFVTSEGSPQMRQMASDAGALFLIAKPFTADSFKDALAPVGI